MDSGQHTLHKYLINKSQEGDRKAQNELYKLYAGAMYNVCRRMMGDDEMAKDVLQDAFVTVFTKIKSLKEEATFSVWIKRIVVNHCINELKKKRIITSTLEDNVDVMIEEDITDDFRKHEVQQIKAAIEKISAGCRTVLNLYVFEGYDHREISTIMSISESASKAQYSKAKSKIRKILNQ